MLIFLVGYAGSGKSSMGKHLARRLGVKFIDTDAEVEREVGATIAEIFLYEGEEYFRRSERECVEHIAEQHIDAVVSTGGGLPTWSDNMSWLNEHGMTVYLERSAEQILSRLSAYGRERRPMFRGKSDEELLAFMKMQMMEREPHYTQARMTIDCRTMSDAEAVEYIATNLRA